MGTAQVPFIDHLHELRRRLVYCVVALVACGGIGYALQAQILHILVRPLGRQLYYATPGGGFSFYFNVCLLFAALCTLPIIFYNVIRFIQPAIPANTHLRISTLMVSSVLLAAGGAAFAYFYSLPAALHFLMGFGNNTIAPMLFANEYLNFVVVYILSFAVLFQLPVIVSFVDRITPLTPGKMMSVQRHVILISFILAALLTPTPDPVNQLIMASPIVLLYQFSILYVWWRHQRHHGITTAPATTQFAQTVTTTAKVMTYNPSTTPNISTPQSATQIKQPVIVARPSRPVIQDIMIPRRVAA